MVGILGSILAGGVAGGAKNYVDVMDTRIEDKREAARAAALEKRAKSLALYQHELGRAATMEARAYQEGRENVQDADARNIAALLRNEERGEGTGILAETGGDVYSAPMTEKDLTGSMTGKGQLAYEEKRMAMDAAEDEKQYKREQDAFSNKLEQRKLDLLIKKAGEGKAVTLYGPNGEKVTTKDAERVKDLTSRGWTDIEYPETSATEIKRQQEESDNLLMGKIPGFDPQTKNAIVDIKDKDTVISALRENGYPNAAVVKDSEQTESKYLGLKEGDTTVTISAGRFDHTAIGSQGIDESAELTLSPEAQSLYQAYESKDMSVLDNMSKEQYKAAVMELASGDRAKAKQINDAFRQMGKPTPTVEGGGNADQKPGILNPADYKDKRKGDPLAEKDEYDEGYLLPGVPRAIKKAKGALTDKSEWQKMVDFAPKPY